MSRFDEMYVPNNQVTVELIEYFLQVETEESDELMEIRDAKVELIKRNWEDLFYDSKQMLKAQLELVDMITKHGAGIAIRRAMLAGAVLGMAIGIKNPPTHESLGQFSTQVAALVDRRHNGCGDPSCLACSLRAFLRGGKRPKSTVVH